MRWTNEGATCMAQVRVAIFNQKFSPDSVSELEIALPSRDRPTKRAGNVQHRTRPCRPYETDLPHFCTFSSTPGGGEFSIVQNSPTHRVICCSHPLHSCQRTAFVSELPGLLSSPDCANELAIMINVHRVPIHGDSGSTNLTSRFFIMPSDVTCLTVDNAVDCIYMTGYVASSFGYQAQS
jgi:hypothetical protein